MRARSNRLTQPSPVFSQVGKEHNLVRRPSQRSTGISKRSLSPVSLRFLLPPSCGGLVSAEGNASL